MLIKTESGYSHNACSAFLEVVGNDDKRLGSIHV